MLLAASDIVPPELLVIAPIVPALLIPFPPLLDADIVPPLLLVILVIAPEEVLYITSPPLLDMELLLEIEPIVP